MKNLAILIAALSLPAALLAAEPGAAPAANPAINLDIATPMTAVIHHAWQQRQSRLVKYYEPGVIGLKSNGDIAIREGGMKISLAQRQTAEKLIDADNSDRQALIASIADGNRRRDALPEIRAAMAKRWAAGMKSGWWIQDDQGKWIRKP